VEPWNPLTRPFQRPYAPIVPALKPDYEEPAKLPAWARVLIPVTRALSIGEGVGAAFLETIDPFNILPHQKDERPFKERLKSTAYTLRDITGPVSTLAYEAAKRVPLVGDNIPSSLKPFDRDTSALRAAAEYGAKRVFGEPGEQIMEIPEDGSPRALGLQTAKRYYNWQETPGDDFKKTLTGILIDPTTYIPGLGLGKVAKVGAQAGVKTAGREVAERAAREAAASAAEKQAGKLIMNEPARQAGKAGGRNFAKTVGSAAARGALEVGLGVGPKRAVPFALGAAAGQEVGRWITEQLPGENTFLQAVGPLAGAIIGGGLGAGSIRDVSSVRAAAVEEGAETAARRAAQAEAQAAAPAIGRAPQLGERENRLLEAYAAELEKVPGWQNSYYAQLLPPEHAAILGIRPSELTIIYSSEPDELYRNLRNGFLQRRRDQLRQAGKPIDDKALAAEADEYARATKGMLDQFLNLKQAREDIEEATSTISIGRARAAEEAEKRGVLPASRVAETGQPEVRTAEPVQPRVEEEQAAPPSQRPLNELDRRIPAVSNPFRRRGDEYPEEMLARADADGLRNDENSSDIEFDIEEGEGYYYLNIRHAGSYPYDRFEEAATKLVTDAFGKSVEEINDDPVLRARAARAYEQVREAIEDYYGRQEIRAYQTGEELSDEIRLPWESISIDRDGNVSFEYKRLQGEDFVVSRESAQASIALTGRKAARMPAEKTEQLGLPAIEMTPAGRDTVNPIRPATKDQGLKLETPDVAPPGRPSALSENVAWSRTDIERNAPNTTIITSGDNDLGIPDPRLVLKGPDTNPNALPNAAVIRDNAKEMGRTIANALAEKNPEGPVVIAIRNENRRLSNAEYAFARDAASRLGAEIRKELRAMADAAEGEEAARLRALADRVYVIPNLVDGERPRVEFRSAVKEEESPPYKPRHIREVAAQHSARTNEETVSRREKYFSEFEKRKRRDQDEEPVQREISKDEIEETPFETSKARPEPGLEGRPPRKYEIVRIRLRKGSSVVRYEGGYPEEVKVATVEEIVYGRPAGDAVERDEIAEAFEEARARPSAKARQQATEKLKSAAYEMQDAAADIQKFAAKWTSPADDQRAVFVTSPGRARDAEREATEPRLAEEEKIARAEELEERREQSAQATVNRIIRATKSLLAGEEAPRDETGGLRESHFDVADRTIQPETRRKPADGNYIEGVPYEEAPAEGTWRPMKFHPDTGRWVPQSHDAAVVSYAPKGVKGPQSGRMRVTVVASKIPYYLYHNKRLNRYRPAYITIWWRDEDGTFRPYKTLYTVHADAAPRIASLLTEIATAINTLFDVKALAAERRTGMVRAVIDPVSALAYAIAFANRNKNYNAYQVATHFIRRLESILSDPSPSRVNEALLILASLRDTAMRNAGYAVTHKSVQIPADAIAKTRREIAIGTRPPEKEKPPWRPAAGREKDAKAQEETAAGPRRLTPEEKARLKEYRDNLRRAMVSGSPRKPEEPKPSVETAAEAKAQTTPEPPAQQKPPRDVARRIIGTRETPDTSTEKTTERVTAARTTGEPEARAPKPEERVVGETRPEELEQAPRTEAPEEIRAERVPAEEPERVLPPDAAKHGPHGRVDADTEEISEAAIREAAADATPIAEPTLSTRQPIGPTYEQLMRDFGYRRDPDGTWTLADPKSWPWTRITILRKNSSLRRRAAVVDEKFRKMNERQGEEFIYPEEGGFEKAISLGDSRAPSERAETYVSGRREMTAEDRQLTEARMQEAAETLRYRIHPFNARIRLADNDPKKPFRGQRISDVLEAHARKRAGRVIGSFDGTIEDFRQVIIRRGVNQGVLGFHGPNKTVIQIDPRQKLRPGELPEEVQMMRLYALYFSQNPGNWDILTTLIANGYKLTDEVFAQKSWNTSPAVPIAALYESGFKPDPRFADYRPSGEDVVAYMQGRKSLDDIAPDPRPDIEMAPDAPMACVFDAIRLEG
jgi:phage baseplate assembly protein W